MMVSHSAVFLAVLIELVELGMVVEHELRRLDRGLRRRRIWQSLSVTLLV
jgi:hypothetical protein